MCNRYAQAAPIAVLRHFAQMMEQALVVADGLDNLPPQPNIYPDQDAPIITQEEGHLTLTRKRWGFPPIPGQKAPITNIRNLSSKWWREVNGEFLRGPAYRCLVPFTAFAEPVRTPTWFTVPEAEVAFFAGIWRPWRGERLKEVPGKARRQRQQDDWQLFAFLTTQANAVVRPVHEKAMPVILWKKEECARWLSADPGSLQLQRPLPEEELAILPPTG